MPNTHHFKEQVALLLDVLPFIASYSEFALKGGTAINLFVQNMPRLSVDIDLVYLPLQPREDALANIHQLLHDLAMRIQKRFLTVKMQEVQTMPLGQIRQLICFTNRVQIKIEVNIIIRGALFLPERKELCIQAQKIFGRFVKMTVLSEYDLYGGKICAALDRQHPRDLFDMYLFFKQNPIINEQFKKAFLFYLLSHNRPIAELLNPRPQDIEASYVNNFEGMSDEPVCLADLLEVRLTLIAAINAALTENDKVFLLSFKKGAPQWAVIDAENFQNYPAIQWKLHNIKAMAPDKHAAAIKALEAVLKN